MSVVDISKHTVKILKNNTFWKDFLDSISEELQNVKDEIDIKKNYLDIPTYTDPEEIAALGRDFGYATNLILHEDLSYVQREISSIYYKIINKASYNFYYYMFKLIPNEGHTYILYKDFLKLVKALDISTIYSHLSEHQFGNIFNYFQEEQHFDTTIDQPILFDDDPVLEFDQETLWFMDIDLFVQPTKHLSFEYSIDNVIVENLVDYSITSKYFDFMSRFIQYGKKITDIPHIGCQHNFVLPISKYFNLYDLDDSDYTIDDTKVRVSVTKYFREESDVVPMDFDEYPTSDFDEEFLWAFDTTSEVLFQKEDEDLLYNLVVGDSTKSLHYKEYPNIDNGLILYTPFDEIKVSDVTDLSTNKYAITVNGTITKNQGPIGKSLLFDGTTGYLSIPSFQIIDSNKQIYFWIQSDYLASQVGLTSSIIYQSGFIDILYDSLTETILVHLTGGSGTQSLVAILDQYDTAEHQICLDISVDTMMVYLYLDNVLQDSDHLTAGTLGSTNTLYIGSQAGSNFYKGIIDELRIYSSNEILDEDYRTYLYEKKIGSLLYLSNPIYTEKISPNEIFNNDDWKIAFTQIPSFSINKEVILEANGVLDTTTGFLKYYPVIPNYITIDYYSVTKTMTAVDDGLGNLLGDSLSGTINYETGEYDIDFYRSFDNSELVASGSQTDIDYITENTNITPTSIELIYWISDTEYTAVDDGSGNIVGTGILYDFIDYVTGEIQVTFTSLTDVSKNIIINYSHISSNVPSDLDVTISYKTTQDVQITEAGIEDNEGRIVTYATFPPVQFQNIYNHLSCHFIMQNDE